MCQLCGLPNNHDNDLELLGYVTLAAWTTTALLGIWWWHTTRRLRLQAQPTAQSSELGSKR